MGGTNAQKSNQPAAKCNSFIGMLNHHGYQSATVVWFGKRNPEA
jgi:hypothetical protein